MDRKTKRHFIGAGHIGRLERKLPESFIPPCKHDPYCTKLQTISKAHCSKDYMENCGQVKKYYDKWGEGWNHMGVGL